MWKNLVTLHHKPLKWQADGGLKLQQLLFPKHKIYSYITNWAQKLAIHLHAKGVWKIAIYIKVHLGMEISYQQNKYYWSINLASTSLWHRDFILYCCWGSGSILAIPKIGRWLQEFFAANFASIGFIKKFESMLSADSIPTNGHIP